MRLLISQPLTNNTFNGGLGPLLVINSKLRPRVVAEIELREIAMQMGLADVVERANDPALEEREVAFGGVGVRFATDVFANGVVHGLMALATATDAR